LRGNGADPPPDFTALIAELPDWGICEAGYSSNHGNRKQPSWVYLTGEIIRLIRSHLHNGIMSGRPCACPIRPRAPVLVE
jgi:hypothetical protein